MEHTKQHRLLECEMLILWLLGQTSYNKTIK